MSGFGSITAGSDLILTSVSASTITASYISASTYYGLPGGGGSTSPGGLDKQVQFNSGSSFSGSSNLTFNYTTNTLSSSTAQFTTMTGSTITGSTALFTTINSTTITGSTITGSTALFGTITGSDISSSATLQVGTTLTVGTSVNVGGGTPVTKMKLYSVNFTGFNSINGNSTSQQSGSFAANSFSGMSSNDTLFVNGLGAQWATSPIVITSITASAAGPLFTFRNTTSSAATPPLGVYKIFAITT